MLLIGFGIRAPRDETHNRGIVVLGNPGQVVRVVNQTTMYAWNIARPLVIEHAAIDGPFALATVAFWLLNGPPTELRGYGPAADGNRA
ncbi:hypothetical protein NFX46_19375 [Streptomyces phaeoluteigriseus]|uniref:Uncharacterized protein n=1 Tax=Streptomyces phaeoluteigriseus TaxID=114686 RepID=A0ABY4ZB39_9ACTN|nr:hypothetical protein [Streptomyces phaeoluteigriseus]USQ85730.1 hypothetical protein NFX46_19375 [Streptomyces phaeoluteigriseus]